MLLLRRRRTFRSWSFLHVNAVINSGHLKTGDGQSEVSRSLPTEDDGQNTFDGQTLRMDFMMLATTGAYGSLQFLLLPSPFSAVLILLRVHQPRE
jgi:hypothetical protein